MNKAKQLVAKIKYWLAWKLAGQRIWGKAVMWSAQHIYLYSTFLNGKEIILPEGITVADKPVILTSGMTLDGGGHILTEAVNKHLQSVIEVPPNAENVLITGTVILGHGDIRGYAPSSAILIKIKDS